MSGKVLSPDEYAAWVTLVGEKKVKAALREVLQFMKRRGVELLKEETKRRGIRDRGAFYKGWGAAIPPGADHVVFFNKAPHSIYVLEGRKRGSRQPPSSPIEDWLVRRGHPRKLAKGLAFVVARAIGRRGIPAKPVYRITIPRILFAGRARINAALTRVWSGR